MRPRLSMRLADRMPGASIIDSTALRARPSSPRATAGAAISATTTFIAALTTRVSWRETAHCWSMKVTQAATSTATVVTSATLAIRA